MVTYAFLTGEGNCVQNEDVVGIFDIEEFDKLFLLADGDGLPMSVGAAAEIIKTAVKDTYLECYETENSDCLKKCFEKANQALEKAGKRRKWKERKLEQRSTLCLLQVTKDTVQWGHVGDSRIYHFHKNRIVNRTLDHSMTQVLCSIGELKEEEIRFHPERKQLIKTMSISQEEQSFVLSDPIPVEKGDTFLICSDGFWELVDEYEMRYAALETKDVDEWLTLMECYLLKNGKEYQKDNYSAIAIRID